MRLPRLIPLIVMLALLLVGVIVVRDQQRRHPERLPWTPLSLARPIGPFTGIKIVALTENADQCRQLLREAGVAFTPLPPIAGEQCGYADGVTLVPGGSLTSRFRPATLATACPVAAALLVWEREIVRPAAQRHFGADVAEIEHFGSFNCRRIAGSANWSEHATADAIDIAGFKLAADAASASSPAGPASPTKRRSCARCATAPAGCSGRRSRPITTPPMPTISTSTRPAAA